MKGGDSVGIPTTVSAHVHMILNIGGAEKQMELVGSRRMTRSTSRSVGDILKDRVVRRGEW